MTVLIIAEAGMNHDGSLGNAMRLAETAAEAGADAVKFQLHDAGAETVRAAPSPPYFRSESRYDYFERTAFDDEGWRALAACCERAGIEFMCSAFSVEALERVEALGVRRHKVPSGEVTNLELVARAARGGRGVLLSSGMSSWAELDAAVAAVDAEGGELVLLQCTSAYPCPPERVGLNLLEELRERYGRPVGLSDHTLGPAAAYAAVALGAVAVEKHFTLSRAMYGPDAALAAEPDELRELVAGVREIERMLASPVDKDDLADLAEMKRVFEKSVVALADIPEGAVITAEMVGAKKPGTGIPARRLADVVGRTARRRLEADSVLAESDLEWEA